MNEEADAFCSFRIPPISCEEETILNANPICLKLTKLELAYLVIALDEFSNQTNLRITESLENKLWDALKS